MKVEEEISPVDPGLNVDATTKESSAKQKKKDSVPFRQLFRFADCTDYFLITVGALCGMATGGSLAGFSVILGSVFDALNGTNPGASTEIALWFVYLACGTFVVATLQVATFTTASERMTIKLRQRYLEAVLSQDVSFFDDAALSGSITTQVAENALMFREALGEKFGSVFQFGAMFFGGLIVGFLYIWQLCLVIIGMAPFLGFSGYFMAKSMATLVSGQLDSYASAGQIAEESLQLIRTVTSFGMQRSQLHKYNVELERSSDMQTKQGLSMGLGFGFTMFFYFSSYAIAFYVGAILIVNSKVEYAAKYPLSNPPPFPFCAVGQEVPELCRGGSLSQVPVFFESEPDICSCPLCGCGCWFENPLDSSCISGGDVILTFFSVLIGSFAIGQAAPSITAISNGKVAAASLYRVIDRKPQIDALSEEGEKPTSVQGEIEFRHVRFAYPTRRELTVFTDLNLTIPSGKRVALVGESGSGKSTCIGLIERYYDPDSGSVLLDGVDIRQLNVKHLRTLIGLVSQEPILFGTSILENVRFGLPNATDEQVIQACKDANAHDFISTFPEQYNTFVSSSLVSGGQKQRIAIARALLRNPQILLLDEATAALDNESERLVNEAIERLLTVKRTTIVIAHRLSSIRACDKIIVMEKGRVVEEGSHNELVQRVNGLYASLVKLSEGGKLPEARVAVAAAAATEDGKDTQNDNNDATGTTHNTTMVAIEDVVAKEESTSPKKNYPIRYAFRYAHPERFYFIPAIVSAAINGLTFPVFALIFSNVLETFFFPNSTNILYSSGMWSLAFLGLAIANGVALLFQNWTFGFINGKMTKRVRSALFEHLLSMDIGFFDMKENNVGTLTSKLASDAALLRAAILDRIAVGTMNLATMVAGFTVAFVASWQVSLVVFAMFPAIAISGAIQFMVMSGMAGSDQKALELAAQTLTESVNGIRTVSAFGMQPSIKELYMSQLLGPLKKAKRKGLISGLGFGFSQAIMFFAYALTFWYGSQLVASREIAFKDLNQALFGILMTAMAIGQTAAMAPDMAKGQAAVNSVFSSLALTSKINGLEDDAGKLKPSVFLGDLQFENIQFAYPSRPEVTVLAQFNLTVPRGSTVAFVGTSGSGKSTLVLLLERFYDPLQGVVRVDGHDVRSLSVQWLREQIGIVSQEPALFRGSILDNIRNGKLDATDEECMEACKMANAHDFIMNFPLGYGTDLQTCQGVSGGQKQRIAIARALVRNPKLLLLDEATSALDEESQRIVQNALDRLLQVSNRTTVVVAHRLSTIRNADVIVVLQNGIVVEQGSFDVLANKPQGAFQMLLRAQDNKA